MFKKHEIASVIFLFLFSLNVFAENPENNQVSYYCPMVSDIKNDNYNLNIQTIYNNFTVNWGGLRPSGDYSPVIQFLGVKLTDGGYGHPYAIECTYKNAQGNLIRIQTNVQFYKANSVIGSNWKGDNKTAYCESSNPQDCLFWLNTSYTIQKDVAQTIESSSKLVALMR